MCQASELLSYLSYEEELIPVDLGLESLEPFALLCMFVDLQKVNPSCSCRYCALPVIAALARVCSSVTHRSRVVTHLHLVCEHHIVEHRS